MRTYGDVNNFRLENDLDPDGNEKEINSIQHALDKNERLRSYLKSQVHFNNLSFKYTKYQNVLLCLLDIANPHNIFVFKKRG